MCGNGSAMVSTGIKSSKLSIKYLAKTFYFVLSFLYKAKSKSFGGLSLKSLNFGFGAKIRINYSHCYMLFMILDTKCYFYFFLYYKCNLLFLIEKMQHQQIYNPNDSLKLHYLLFREFLKI